jgi:hypothetical protein
LGFFSISSIEEDAPMRGMFFFCMVFAAAGSGLAGVNTKAEPKACVQTRMAAAVQAGPDFRIADGSSVWTNDPRPAGAGLQAGTSADAKVVETTGALNLNPAAPDPSSAEAGWLRAAMTDFRMPSSTAVFAPADPSGLPKKPALAVLLSAAVPGAGEIYAGSWIKGAAFLGIEAALWFGYARYMDRGQDLEDEFHVYAETHWSETRWRSKYNPQTDPYTDELPDTRTQQYYEMIGKYDQFMKGWDDWMEGGPDLTRNRDHYETMRDDSNRKFIAASRCAMGVIANRLVSALDAAWTVHRRNRALSVRLNADVRMVRSEPITVVGLRIGW